MSDQTRYSEPEARERYESLRRRHLERAFALAPGLIERLGWPAERLAAHRAQRLRELVAHAVDRSPWHRSRLSGCDVARLTDNSLRELPAMTKTDLMNHFDQIATDPRLSLELVNAHLQTVSTGSYLLDRYTAVTSGGSTGERGVFVYDWEGWATMWVGLFRYLLRATQADLERRGVWAWVAAAHFTHATAALSRTFASPQLVNLRFPVTLATEEIVAGLNHAQPDCLLSYPSALHVLSSEARAGRLRITPRRVICFAEPLLPEIRAAAEQAWEVRVGNLWGLSEVGGGAIPCDHSGSHLGEDLSIVEPVDQHGRPVAPGERSVKVYLTNLYNYALPLIRYEVTDEVTVLKETCPCGSAHRLLADIQGRLDDVFDYHGLRVHPHLFRSLLGRHPEVVEYQVRQTERGARIAVRCLAPVGLKAIGDEISGALAAAGLRSPAVKVETVDRLARDGGPAKLKRFVPLQAFTNHDAPAGSARLQAHAPLPYPAR